MVQASAFGLQPSPDRDQTVALQKAIDQCAERGVALLLPPGEFVMGGLQLRTNTRLIGAPGMTVLRYNGIGTGILAANAGNVRLEHLSIDGANLPLDRARTAALVQLSDCIRLVLDDVQISNAAANGLHLIRSAGTLNNTHISHARDAGVFSLDADTAQGALTITGGSVTDCADSGILIWRSAKGADGSRISAVSIARIGNRSGGSGQYGNGVNAYRAGNVTVSDCRITDCTYSAIRGNSADHMQMRANHASRIGEVALYAEFGFEGAVISSNVVDDAATGIAVTNFNEGGRLAVIEGNLIRSLKRREFEPVDKRGEGIAVEADAAITGNVIEGAPTVGLMIGWGPHLRDVVATGNLIRHSRIGIAISGVPGAGQCLIANNLISGATAGAIRAMDHAKPLGGDLLAGLAPKHIMLANNVAR
jgi:uncharacterized secreted repeat protein (TIGR03808 family)